MEVEIDGITGSVSFNETVFIPPKSSFSYKLKGANTRAYAFAAGGGVEDIWRGAGEKWEVCSSACARDQQTQSCLQSAIYPLPGTPETKEASLEALKAAGSKVDIVFA